jgi:hypothetical protein
MAAAFAAAIFVFMHVAALYERRPRMEVSTHSADFPGPVILA